MNGNGDLVDARVLLALTARLRSVRERVATADVTEPQRRRWQHTLASIAEGAACDLERADRQLHRFVAQLDRAQV